MTHNKIVDRPVVLRGLSSIWSLALNVVVPILGVLFFDWNLFAIMYLFWIQLIVIGAITVLGILFSISGNQWLISMITNIPYLLFFAVLYIGMLMIVLSFSMVSLDLDIALSGENNNHLGIGLITIIVAAIVDFVRDFFISGYYKRSHPIGEIFLTFIGALPLAIILLFVIIPLSQKFDGITANKILIIGIIILKGALEYYMINARHKLYSKILGSK